MTPAERITALETEFERLKDRADTLNRILEGNPGVWVHIIDILPQHIGSIELDKPVAEARQTALALSAIAKTLSQLKGEDSGTATVDPLAIIKQKSQDEVAARRAAKAL